MKQIAVVEDEIFMREELSDILQKLSLIHISEPTRQEVSTRIPCYG